MRILCLWKNSLEESEDFIYIYFIKGIEQQALFKIKRVFIDANNNHKKIVRAIDHINYIIIYILNNITIITTGNQSIQTNAYI